MDDFQSFLPSFDELFDRLWGNFGAFGQPKGARTESLNVEVVLSPEEARRGRRVCIDVPAWIECHACGGRGAAAGFTCWHCGGDGSFVAEQSIDVDYPAGLRDGYVARVPLSQFGIGNFYFTVVFRISADGARP